MEQIFTAHDMMLTLALVFIAFAISGATALAIFWPLTKVHLRDAHPAWREDQLQGKNEFLWFFNGGYKVLNDRSLNGLARPLQLALWVIAIGLVGAWALWLLSEYVIK